MYRHSIEAQAVQPGDIMNFVEFPRGYDRVIRVENEGDYKTTINFSTEALASFTVKHPREGVAVWRDYPQEVKA